MSSDSTPRIVLWERLTTLGLVVAVIQRWRGRQLAIMHTSPLLDRGPGPALLRKLGLSRLILAELPCDSGYEAMKISCRLTRLVMDHLFPGGRVFEAVLAAFTGVTDAKSIEVVVHTMLQARLARLGSVLAIAQSLMAVHQAPLRLFVPLSLLERLALRLGYPELQNDCPAVWAWPRAVMAALGVLLKGGRSLVRGLKRATARSESSPPPAHRPDPGAFEVLFFPCQSPAYGNLFLKDYYYDPDPDSPLAQDNVLHVEYSREYLATTEGYYSRTGLHYVILDRCPPFRLVVHGVVALAALVGQARGLASPLVDRLCGLCLLWVTLVVHRYFRERMAPFVRAKLAIVGYDYLFPRALAMALQSRGIKVAAAVERFAAPFFPDCTAIFDLFLVPGPRVIRELAAHPLCRIGAMRAVGCPRCDLMRDIPLRARRDGEIRILVLDFHSELSREETRLNWIVNWENNKAFYYDILRLAQRFPQASFVIRGKNDQWCRIPYFADIREAISRQPNIGIDHNYDRFNVSYNLAAQSDLILARHTSLGAEALARGLPVLFHDYAPNCRAMISDVYDYDGYPIFVHSYDELEGRIGAFLAGEPLMPNEDFQRLREDFFAVEPDAGPVRDRILHELRRLLVES